MGQTSFQRRQFLQFLAASPLASQFPATLWASGQSGELAEFPNGMPELISEADQALDVFDLQRIAEKTLPPAHYGYLATGTDSNETLRANRSAFEHVYLRPRRMVDTSRVDTRLSLLGESLSSPIIIAPVGSQRAFHPDGELATAQAARTKDHLQILSNVTTVAIEDVIKARGAPVWFQLYPTPDFAVASAMVRRAERAGAKVLVLTVDLNGGSNRVAMNRFIATDTRDCTQCHDPSRPGAWLDRKPMYFELNADGEFFDTPEMTWNYIARLREITKMAIVVKGIVTAEDAEEALQHGVDAVYVSNHGGRAEASGRGALSSLPEVVSAVSGEVPVIIDSGFRRGSDIFKALALGADAVGIGRPYIWGLAAFGQAGVEQVLELLRAELAMVMSQMGTPALADISHRSVARRP
ncbi:MAG: alpha-hydroxy acid oxidase [Woeseia sp.]